MRNLDVHTKYLLMFSEIEIIQMKKTKVQNNITFKFVLNTQLPLKTLTPKKSCRKFQQVSVLSVTFSKHLAFEKMINT